jgi:hypothetical protein
VPLFAGLRRDIRRRGTARRSGAQARNEEHEAIAEDTSVGAGRVRTASPTHRDREEEGTQGSQEADAVD